MCGRIVIAPHYNIAPTADLSLQTCNGNKTLKWGYQVKTNFLINTRSDNNYYKTGFCILQVDGYYEWIDKQPFYITCKNPMQIGCVSRNNEFLIMTTEAGPFIDKIHHRMPVILRGEDVENWLNANSFKDAKALISSKDDDLQYWPVAKLVNKVGNNSKECIMKIKVQIQPKLTMFASQTMPKIKTEINDTTLHDSNANDALKGNRSDESIKVKVEGDLAPVVEVKEDVKEEQTANNSTNKRAKKPNESPRKQAKITDFFKKKSIH